MNMSTNIVHHKNGGNLEPTSHYLVLRQKNDLGLKIYTHIDTKNNLFMVFAKGPFRKIENVRVLINQRLLIIQAGIPKEISKPYKLRLVNTEILKEMNSGYFVIKNSEIILPEGYYYKLNNYSVVNGSYLKIYLKIKRDQLNEN